MTAPPPVDATAVSRWPTAKRAAMLALLIGLLIGVASLPAIAPLLIFDREAIQRGEWWRLLTASLPHLGWAHGLINAVVWWLLWLGLPSRIAQTAYQHPQARVAEPLLRDAAVLAGTLLLGMLAHAGVWLWFVSIDLSRGLSGALHGLVAWWLLTGWLRQRKTTWLSWYAYGFLILLLKLVSEHAWRTPLLSSPFWSFQVNAAAHLMGAAAGAITALALPLVNRLRARRTDSTR